MYVLMMYLVVGGQSIFGPSLYFEDSITCHAKEAQFQRMANDNHSQLVTKCFMVVPEVPETINKEITDVQIHKVG